MTIGKPGAFIMGELTPAFVAMNGRDKWETLVLNGLIGTGEPWIPAMTETLRREANLIEKLEAALDRIASMTDIEADFDGFEARDIASAALSLLRGDGPDA